MSPESPNYFIGKVFDTKNNNLTNEPVMFDPNNLLTHGVVVGMTGSGKTGLCVCFLEEAALHSTPAIIIDPKGDLTNLVLHFPKLEPAKFQEWLDEDVARRRGMKLDELATETATSWRNGLSEWGLGEKQLEDLTNSAEFAIYTPGSTYGRSINVLSLLEAPQLTGNEKPEELRERVSSSVSALLGIVGYENIEPMQSREHILVSTLVESSWLNKQSLPLEELILQVQNPPIKKLGAFPMETFFPEKERFTLAVMLNNFLASPTFKVWQQGQTLDIDAMLYGKDKKPRHSIFYLAHLSDKERMFFVTLLFTAIEGWYRRQQGTQTLKAIVYFDEILGYLPPVANPPSKVVMLRMIKQARAFGVGLLLATQNPVDLDYKALSNAGTWMIGRLQTEQDKKRLVDGLTSSAGETDIAEINKLISGLPKRHFLLHSIYKKDLKTPPIQFQSRWALNYLAGPIPESKLFRANDLVGANTKPESGKNENEITTVAQMKPVSTEEINKLSANRPAVPGNIDEYVMPMNRAISELATEAGLINVDEKGTVYKAGLLAQAEIMYLSKQYNLEHKTKMCAIIQEIGSGLINWENLIGPGIDRKTLLSNPPLQNSQYYGIPNWLSDEKKPPEIEREFKEWVYRNGTIKLKANLKLKVFGGLEMSDEDFRKKCEESVKDLIETDIEKAARTYDTKISALERKIETQELDVNAAEKSVNQRRLETLVTGGSAVIGMLTGRRRSITSTISKTRMASAAKDKLTLEEETLSQYKEQLVELQKAREEVVKEVTDKWDGIADNVTEITVRPTKSDIFTDIFGVVWLPYFQVEASGKKLDLPAFRR